MAWRPIASAPTTRARRRGAPGDEVTQTTDLRSTDLRNPLAVNFIGFDN
jgi:hypothetical protein